MERFWFTLRHICDRTRLRVFQGESEKKKVEKKKEHKIFSELGIFLFFLSTHQWFICWILFAQGWWCDATKLNERERRLEIDANDFEMDGEFFTFRRGWYTALVILEFNFIDNFSLQTQLKVPR